jgi:GNAT superfamily N-acetyltransferase
METKAMGRLLIREATSADAEAMARIQVEGWRTAYARFTPEQLPGFEVRLKEWQQRLAEPLAGTVHLVAIAAGETVGICSGGPILREEAIIEGGTDDYTAQLYRLYVAPGLYRRGVGRSLIGDLARRLAAHGHRNLCVFALEINPYRGFYDRLGGRTIARCRWHFGEKEVFEVAYGWPETDSLIRACGPSAETE